MPPSQLPPLPPDNQTPKSVDDQIAQETHLIYEFAHTDSAGGMRGPMQNFIAYHKPLAIGMLAGVLLLFGGAGITVSRLSTPPSKDDPRLIASDQESIAEEDVYGTSLEDSYYYELDTGETGDIGDTDTSDGTPKGKKKSSTTDGYYNSKTKEFEYYTYDNFGDVRYSPTAPKGSKAASKPRVKTPTRSAPAKSVGRSSGGGISTTPPKTSTPSPSQPTVSKRFDVVSWNYAHGKPVSNMVAGVKTLSDKTDVIGFQEFGPSNKRDALKNIVKNCASCNFGLYMPSISNGGNLPIVWKKNVFRLIGTGNMKVYDKQTVEDGAGGRNVTAKHITWVKLQHRGTNKSLYVVNLHLIPSAIKNGRLSPDKPKRAALYKKHISALRSKVNNLRSNAPVIVIGDFNINYPADARVKHSALPYRQLGGVNIWSNWRIKGTSIGGTHGGSSYIDYLWVTQNNALTMTSHTVLPKYGSDHNALRGSFTL